MSTEALPPVAVIILNWNGLADTRACLQALRQSVYEPAWVLVFDNGSRDGSPEALRAEFPEVEVLTSPTNLGYAGGNNRGLQWAQERGAELALLLNNDTLPPPEMIGTMVAAYQAADRPGLLTVRERVPGAEQTRGDRLGARWLPLSCRVQWLFAPSADDPAGPVVEVDAVSGCALLVSAEVLNGVGLLDEMFFAYWEDTDWSLRARAAGYRNYCATAAHVVHLSGRSTGQERGPNLRQLYLVCRGQALITRKQARGLGRVTAPARLLASGLLAIARGLLQPGYRPTACAKVRGLRDGWRRRPPHDDYLR
jgi:hypothetical protein